MSKTLERKIFIVGVAHSGTTILYRMMAYHPELAWFCQFSQRNSGIPGRFRLPFSDFIKRNIRKIHSHSWKKGGSGILIPRPGEAWRILRYIKDNHNQKERKLILRSVVDSELRSWGKNHIILKNPEFGLELDWIEDAFPGDSLFIHIVRDGRAVILSDLHKFLRRNPEDAALDQAIEYWCRYMESLIRFRSRVGEHRIRVIRYEDFITDIHAHLKDLLRFCGLEPDGFDFCRLPESLVSSNARWINEQNSRKIRRIESRAQKYLKHFNYF